MFKRFQRGSAAPAIFIVLMCVFAWFTHIYTCLSEEKWGFLIAGAIMFPIAIVHGIGIWLGLF